MKIPVPVIAVVADALQSRYSEEYMEVDPTWAWETVPDHIGEGRKCINSKLAEYGLAYHKGGYVVRAGAAIVSRGLEEVIRQRDYAGLEAEFQRIYNNIEADPAAAVTSTCALLESLFKIYIADEGIPLPSDQSIKPLWNVVRKHLKLDPSSLED